MATGNKIKKPHRENLFSAKSLPSLHYFFTVRFDYHGLEVWGRAEKLSLTEILALVPEPLNSGVTGHLNIETEELRGHLACKAIVTSQKKQTDEQYLITFEILRLSQQNQEALIELYTYLLWKEVTSKIPGGHDLLLPGNLVGIFDPEKVHHTLSKILPLPSKNYFLPDSSEEAILVQFKASSKNSFTYRFLKSKAKITGIVPHQRISLFSTTGFRQHLFMGHVKEITSEKVTVIDPFFLLSSSLREEERTQVRTGSMWVEIPLPYPSGSVAKYEIIDISSGGFAFKSPANGTYFLPGTPISTLKILGDKKETFVTSGQVRHVTPVESESGETYLKIGVQFQISNKAFAKGHIQPKSVPKRGKTGKTKTTGKDVRGSGELLPLKKQFKTRSVAGRPSTGISRSQSENEPLIFRHLNKKNQEIVGLLNTTWDNYERRRATVVILPPPYGKRKEALGLFTYYLLDRFRNQFHDAAIIRYDSINNVGESYKDPPCRLPGKECLHMTLSQGTEDLFSILDFVERNKYFFARDVVVVSYSLSALFARKAILKDQRKRVHLWIAPMGVTNMGELLYRVSGGIDYFKMFREGLQLGEVTILGITVGGDRFCEDALHSGYASLEDAIKDMSQIDVPVIWLYGIYDAWIDTRNVEKLLNAKKQGYQKVAILPTGHLPLNGHEAFDVFEAIFEELWHHISSDSLVDFYSDLSELAEKQRQEWNRIPRGIIQGRKQYWANYLFGDNESEIGYDVLCYCQEYVEFIQDQIDLLDARPGNRIADMGCGTGNFVLQFLENYQGKPRSFPYFVLTDLIDEALERAREKCSRLARMKGIPLEHLQYQKADLDIHSSLPLKKFILGEYYDIDQLKGQIPELTNYSIDLWKKNYGTRLHQILRGKILTRYDQKYLDRLFPESEKRIIFEFNLASRILRRNLLPFTFVHPASFSFEGQNTKHLGIDLKHAVFRLPFSDNFFDRLAASLVLSYMKNPQDTLGEFSRCLKPGGVAVFSTMKPDTDISRIYSGMITKITSGEIPLPENQKERVLTATRNFANAAASLIQLVEERRFHFFHTDQLAELTENAGMRVLELVESYGDPPQAYIVKATK